MLDRDFSQAIVDFGNFEFSQIGEALSFGGLMLLIGMATVFAVLCVLWLCLTIFKVCFHDLPAKRQSEATPKEDIPAPVAIATPVSVTDDAEIIAVITAAIAMAESDASGIKFKVVSFRRK